MHAAPPGSPVFASVRRVAAIVLVAVLVAVGCDANTSTRSLSPRPSAGSTPSASPATPSPGPTGRVDPSAIYGKIEREVIALRGLEARGPVTRTTIDEAELRRIVAEITEEEQPPELVAATERLYRGLRLMDGDRSLAAITRELLGEQIAGFYRTDTRELYVVSRSGGVGVAEKVTFAHEFTHALQDQHFPLDDLTADAATQGDRALARTALIEGDATLLMSLWSQEHLSFAELLQLVGLAIGPNQAGLDGVPVIVRESLLFPYQVGLTFVMDLQLQGGWEAVNAAFAVPPDSTEQIIHPEKYAERDEPVRVQLPSDLAARIGAGWTRSLDDTLGEFQLGVWLATGADATVARAAAAGWGGDRVQLLDGPDGRWAIILETAWDTDADAEEFAGAVREVLGREVQVDDPRRVRVVLASDDTSRAAVAAALG